MIEAIAQFILAVILFLIKAWIYLILSIIVIGFLFAVFSDDEPITPKKKLTKKV